MVNKIHPVKDSEPMKSIAAFGEIMLRLSPPGNEKLFQSPFLSARFGGGEANVAVSLAVFGHRVRFISVLPPHEIGEAAVAELRKWGVETDHILRQGKRLGVYFAETGANQRPGKVIYDRENSAVSEAQAGSIDWEAAFQGIDWFHTTGITPALSASAAALTLQAVRRAKEAGIRVSVDLNYRGKLWKYGRTAPEVMGKIVELADVAIGNEDDFQKSLGIPVDADVESGSLPLSAYEKLTAHVLERFPGLGLVAVTLRESRSADQNAWSAVLRNRERFIRGPRYEIADIVDRIGGGDAFAAGLIHGLDVLADESKALAFAVAASCLKQSLPGDFNLATENEVLALMEGDRSGRIKR
jgi:2-dehydro-3-deoxygluconokinase